MSVDFDWSERGYIVGSDHYVPLHGYSCTYSMYALGTNLLEFEWDAFLL